MKATEHDQLVFLDDIEQRVRESPRENAPHFLMDWSACKGMLRDLLQRLTYLIQESVSKTGLSFLVPREGFR